MDQAGEPKPVAVPVHEVHHDGQKAEAKVKAAGEDVSSSVNRGLGCIDPLVPKGERKGVCTILLLAGFLGLAALCAMSGYYINLYL